MQSTTQVEGKLFTSNDASLDLSHLRESERQLVLLAMKVSQHHFQGNVTHLNGSIDKLNKLINRLQPTDESPVETTEA
jgi:hypothetical protein